MAGAPWPCLFDHVCSRCCRVVHCGDFYRGQRFWFAVHLRYADVWWCLTHGPAGTYGTEWVMLCCHCHPEGAPVARHRDREQELAWAVWYGWTMRPEVARPEGGGEGAAGGGESGGEAVPEVLPEVAVAKAIASGEALPAGGLRAVSVEPLEDISFAAGARARTHLRRLARHFRDSILGCQIVMRASRDMDALTGPLSAEVRRVHLVSLCNELCFDMHGGEGRLRQWLLTGGLRQLTLHARWPGGRFSWKV